MADTVQELLEDMVPELEDLARKRIFSQPEIKEIVRRRRDFEYKLKRRESQKSEYLRYVQYERTLDKLRKRVMDLPDQVKKIRRPHKKTGKEIDYVLAPHQQLSQVLGLAFFVLSTEYIEST